MYVDKGKTVSQENHLTWLEAYSCFERGDKPCANSTVVNKLMHQGYSFSWFALLVGAPYYIYRGQYAIGIPWIVCEILIGLLNYNSYLFNALSNIDLIVQIAMAFAFYPIYQNAANKAIRQGVEAGYDERGLCLYLQNKGGTHLGLALGLFFVQLILSTVAMYLYRYGLTALMAQSHYFSPSALF